jgi:transporter family protein
MWAMVCAIGAGLCWGIGELFTKSVLHSGQVGPVTAIAVRSTVALPLLWAAQVVAARGIPGVGAGSEPVAWLSGASGPTLAKLTLGSGVVAGAAAMILFYVALSLGEISRVKPVAFALAPTTAALLAWMLLGEAMTVRKAIGIGLVIAGVILLSRK